MNLLLSLSSALSPSLTRLATERGFDEKVDELFGDYTGWFGRAIFKSIPFSDEVAVPWVVLILVAGALFFTVYFKWINFTGFATAVNIVRGRYEQVEKHEDEVPETGATLPDSEEKNNRAEEAHSNLKSARQVDEQSQKGNGEVSHFQALTTALSATVGLGNIAGVAVALSVGGPGATFWMIVAGLIGMASKFTECTLGVKYREIDENGRVYGGPMYFLQKGLAEKGWKNMGKLLAVLFAVMCIGGSFGGGNMFQSNQAFAMLASYTGGATGPLHGYGWVFGLVMAVLVGIVIIGGIRKIAHVTDKIVPFMVGIYVVAVLVILGIHFAEIPRAFQQIFQGAFTKTGIAGGVFGVLVQGFRRAAFSNEAGIGSASIAHAAVKTRYAASEGLVALLEPFIDTVVVCTMTALVIVITNGDGTIMTYGQKVSQGVEVTSAEKVRQGVEVTSAAFGTTIDFFPLVLTIAVVLFAFSTMISWSYYGYQAWTYLFGRKKVMEYTYKALFCLFVVVGASAKLDAVIGFSDAMIFAMLVPNMIGLFLLAPVAKRELQRFYHAIKKTQQ